MKHVNKEATGRVGEGAMGSEGCEPRQRAAGNGGDGGGPVLLELCSGKHSNGNITTR